jgi:hypothetical protein
MPPISPSPILLNYIIYTTDLALAAAWIAANPSGVQAGPTRLAASQGLTVNYAPAALPDPSGCWFFAAYDGGIFFPGDFAHFDRTVDSGLVDPNDLKTDYTTNWDPIEYKWYGMIFPYYVTAAPSGGAILPRRWAIGFELGGTGNASLATNNSSCSPAGSRLTDGYGYTAIAGGGGDISANTVPVGSGFALSFCSWERFYFRPWVLPNQGEVAIWHANDSLEGLSTCFLTLNTAGQLVFRNTGNAGTPGTVVGTSAALTLGTWVKLDLVIAWSQIGTPATDGVVSLQINGALAFSGVVTHGTSGLGTTNGKHTQSTIGAASTFAVGGLSPTTYKYDVDDWTNVALATPSLSPTDDVLNGTHIRLLNVSGVSAAGAWTGDYRGLAGNPPGITPPNQMSTLTPSSRLLLTTDYVNLPQLGLASVLVHCWPSTWPGGPPIVGYRLNGGALVQNANVGQPGSVNNFSGQLFTVGATPRTDVTTIDVAIDKDAGASTMGIAALFAAAEWIGVFGPEDIPNGSTPVRPPVARTGLHNAPYPEIDAVTYPLQSMAWAAARSGTFVGNGTGQDVSVGVPFHWLWIRAVGSSNTEQWLSSQCAVHRGLNGGFAAIDVGLPVVFPPSGAATSFRVSGSAAAANQVGVTYQWVAFSDPSSRFLLNGAVAWPAATASVANPLQDPAFTPACVFTVQEDMSSSIAGYFYKGPGNATDTANPLTGADTAAVMTFGAGTLTTKANAHSRSPQMAYAAWRKVDATGAAGLVDCVTYIGDGLSSRNIAVNLGGNSPLFAFGIAHTLVSYFRDPGHTGLDSNQINGGIVTTAIIGGGLNYVTVGALLNVTGRVYDIFVIAGAGFAGSWTPNTDGGGNPVTPPWIAPTPVSPLPPVLPVGPPPVVVPPHGWFQSDAGFRGDVVAIGDARPANPRSWKDFVGFATGSAAMLGGSPGIAGIVRNHLVYAASGYTVGTDAPPIRLFGGSYDRELTTIPPTSGGVAHAVVSILVANGTIYVATWDAGTDSATWIGRVFSLDIDSATLTPIGDPFPVGHLPYALTFLNSQLWCGTHRQNPAAAGKIFAIRPGIDAAWTPDFDLATVTQGGVAALAGFHGALYVGTTAAAGTFGKVLTRAADGTYSAVDAGTAGAATANNGYLAFGVFQDALYASYWNNDGTPIARIRRSADGVTWTTAYTGAAGTRRPFLALLVDAGFLLAVGGGLGLTAAIITTDDGATWLDLTPQLPETDRTALPAVGVLVL